MGSRLKVIGLKVIAVEVKLKTYFCSKASDSRFPIPDSRFPIACYLC
ncbi:MAG: hypothetical protein F6J98_15885 [Moorea sp. SIO4G2]|nr:hypothetical protein [Moorena sp. SIO3E8]NEO13113.1 hypothetical protein [Moorena sp. SIO3E8]NEO61829.1 hypothetical protein [Moorena sp. SIO4G2]NEP98131.1 hypothetical protein [Moorena sp. SIO3F7]